MEVLEHSLEKIGVVGSGGREHVLAATMAEHPDVKQVLGFPGNLGFDDMVEKGASTGIGVGDHDGIVSAARQEEVRFMVVGPETPLIAGLVDKLHANGIRTLGPTASGARFEGSKIFTHNFNIAEHISQPDGEPFTDPYESLKFLANSNFLEWVMKADGEAAGKGAGVPNTVEEAIEFLNRLVNGDLKKATETGILWQRRLPTTAPEVSAYTLVDTNGNFMEIATAQDHKRVGDGDTGLNGGGSGSYSPLPEAVYSKVYREAQTQNVENFVEGLKKQGIDFSGVLFSGLMLHKNKANVLEYNVRFGDPESQVILPQMGGYLLELLLTTSEGRLDQMAKPEVITRPRVCIALMSEGYPETPITDREITGPINELGKNGKFFVGGIKKVDDKNLTAGGRVGYAVGEGDTLLEARADAQAVVDQIDYEGKHARTDIAYQAIAAEAA